MNKDGLRNYNAHAMRAMFRRFGILDGNVRDGFHCRICNKEIKASSHFRSKHSEYYRKARDVIESRSYQGVKECSLEAVQRL